MHLIFKPAQHHSHHTRRRTPRNGPDTTRQLLASIRTHQRKDSTVPNGKPNILVIWSDDIGNTEFKEFPPRQEPASFTITQAVDKRHAFLGAD